jgi:fumarate hydratase class I
MSLFQESILELITETSTNLPPDVRRAMADGLQSETPATQASQALNVIATNIDMATQDEGPICQDTGMPTFKIRTPVGINQLALQEDLRHAVAEATRRGKLRPNSVDSLTGKNSGDNLGPGTPIVHFEQWENAEEIEIKLILKGGGCENKNIQYSVPCELPHLGRADRTLDGVRKCILHAVWQAQGQGCSAGALGVCIGGDRTSGYTHAKEQLFRTLDDTNPNPQLAALEDYILTAGNTLGIGTMGFGGQVTLIGCKVGVINRLPASFFVSVAYDCWAFRRLGVILDARTGALKRWLYREDKPAAPMAAGEGFPSTGKEVRLQTPLTAEKVRRLKMGDVVLVSGEIYTGRDAVHAYLMKHDSPVKLQGSVLYHCGPVVLKDNGHYRITAAGPTTSIREEPYQAEIIERFGIRAVMGKGGMGARTLAGLNASGAVYLNAIGGAAQYYSRCIEEVLGVHLLEFGIPEAMWHIRVRDLPAIVTMDSHGNSLHADVHNASAVLLSKLAEPVFS